MTIWRPDLEAHPGPRYLAIVEALAADVSSGALKPAGRMPTHRDLAERLGVTVGTVSRAYAEAARRGRVRAARPRSPARPRASPRLPGGGRQPRGSRGRRRLDPAHRPARRARPRPRLRGQSARAHHGPGHPAE